MEILDTFRVDLPVDEAWRLLLDIERIAPCLPGAQLQEIEGDEYRGVVKVKVGPITAQYQGTAKLESTDDATHHAVIVASGRDTRGQGNASATVNLALVGDGGGTTVEVETDLSITGKVAQFGRGVLADVSAKLLAQFVENLERDVLSGDPEVVLEEVVLEEVVLGEVTADPERPPADPAGNGAGPPGVTEIRRIDGPEAEPVDLFAVGGRSVGKRLVPVAAVLAVVLLVLGIRRVRRRSS